MPDEKSNAVPTPRPPNPTPAPVKGPTINIGDEFGTAERNLPPMKIVGIAIGAIVIVFAIVAFLQRAKPQGGGSLDNVVAVDLPGQNSVLVALTFTLRNSGEKSLWVHDIKGKLVTGSGEQTGEAVSAVDFDRYFQGFPALKAGALQPLSPEDKLQPGQQVQRTVMVSFPVPLDQFNQRKSVSVMIQPYDQPVAIVLSK